MMLLPLYQVDAFAQSLFKGNPAAVCILEGSINEELMLQIAAEMNLSETAFVKLGEKVCDLRWFTPLSEVKLCGHATLASAHVLWSEGYFLPEQTLHFNTLSGVLKTRKINGSIEMDFPALEIEETNVIDIFEEIFQARILNAVMSEKNLLIELESEEDLGRTSPDMEKIRKNSDQGIIITAASKKGVYDFVSRYFAPNVGIDEDPVTGSIHCSLVTYWEKRMGKKEFYAYQASKRGGELWLKSDKGRVFIKGNAVTVFKTELSI